MPNSISDCYNYGHVKSGMKLRGRAAVIYSLHCTSKLHGVNPWQWLVDVTHRLPTRPAKRVTELLRYHRKQEAAK